MPDFDYLGLFEQTYNVHLEDFGVSMQSLHMNEVISFDKTRKKIYINSKYLKTPNIIRKAICNQDYVLTKMLNLKNLKPYNHFSKMFYTMYPMYKVVNLNQIALANGPSNSVFYFKKNGLTFEEPSYHRDKFSFQKTVKEYIIPVIYKKDQVKPYEYISERTLQQAKKVNEVLVKLGHVDKCVFLSEKGLILETDTNDVYIIATDGVTPRKGDRDSRIFQEFRLLTTMLNV